MNTFIGRALIVAIGMLIAGCAGTTIKKDAFARPQKLAIVTISGSAHGMYTSDDEDAKILADSVPACLTELSKSPNIRLLPAKSALSSRAYAAIKDQGPRFTLQLLPGYKEISVEDEKAHLRALARELHVDGFLMLYLSYSKVSGFGVGIGPLAVGSQKPAVDTNIVAVTPDGEVLWSGHVQSVGEDGITTVNGIGAYSYLISKLKGITQTACQQNVKDLREQIAAK